MEAIVEQKQGYKETKLGLIPSDWDLKKLHEVSERVMVGLATSVTEYYTEKSNESVPIIRNMNIKRGYFDDSDMLHLTPEFSSLHPNKRVKGNDVITVHTGSNVGLTCVVPENYHNAQTFTTLVVTTKKDVLNPFFLNYVLNSDFGQYQAERLVVGGGKGNLNTGDFKIYPVILPPLPEQKKIAEILSTWDKGIEQLQTLISEKQKLKKGLMQQLLTGKKRFTGFTDEWKEVNLGDIGAFSKGKGISKAEIQEDGFPAIRYGELYTNHHFEIKKYRSYINSESAELSKKLEKGDLLFAGSGEKQFEIGKCAAFTKDEEAYVGGDVVIFKATTDNPVFLSYVINSSIGIRQRGKMAQGHSVVHIYSKDLQKLKVALPSRKEQDEIVTVFRSLDNQLEQFKLQLDKLQEQKKGLMQKLLTGEVRVKI